MPDDKAARIAALRAEIERVDVEQQARRERLLRLSREAVGDVIAAAGLTDADRDFFISVGLQPITKPARVSSDMVNSHRIALSESRSKKGSDPFLTAIRNGKPRAFTLRGLAAALDISQPMLSAHRKPKGHANSRPIPRDRAEQIAALTGWPADARHWPCGFSS